MSDSIRYLKEWVKGDDGEFRPAPICAALPHILNVLAIAESASKDCDAKLPMACEPMGESLNHFEQRMCDRYHYSLGQIEKAREYLLRGQGAMAVDALWRAKDGIHE